MSKSQGVQEQQDQSTGEQTEGLGNKAQRSRWPSAQGPACWGGKGGFFFPSESNVELVKLGQATGKVRLLFSTAFLGWV